jgi:hypothetical protein
MLLAAVGWTNSLVAQTNCIPCDRASNAGFIPPMIGQASDFAVRRAGAEVDAQWKVPVSQDGWYRLTHAQLVAAGMPSNDLIGSQIRMYCRTQEVAITVTTSNLFTSQDSIFFYGIKHDGAYTRTNMYWLGLGGQGRRIQTISGTALGGETLVTSACYSAVYDAKNLHRPYHQPLNTEIDHWFAALVTTSAQTVVTFNTPYIVTGEVANLSIRMFGLTQQANVNPDHRTRIQVNHALLLAQPTYDDTVLLATNYYFPATNLNAGMNTNYIIQNAVGVSNDVAYLISLRLDHVSRINMLGTTRHEFCGKPGNNIYRVLNLSSTNNNTVLDITDPYAPIEIVGHSYTAMFNTNNLWLIEFRHVSNRISRLAVVQTNGVLAAATPTSVNFRNLGDTGRSADYLMITPYSLRQQAYRLAKHRFTNGLNIAVAPLPDVYDEFGYGIVDADAIKQFIGYAYHHWTAPRPRFALLIGEGTYDPLGYIGSVPSVNVPTLFGPTAFVVAAKDSWYGQVDGTTNGTSDLLPDVIIGRLPLSTTGQLFNAVNKVIAFDGAPITSNALLVADKFVAPNNFAVSADLSIHNIISANGFGVLKVYLPFTDATFTIAQNFGRRLVAYVGHGAVDAWSASPTIFSTNNAATLANTTYPVVTIFSCNNGSFVDRQTNCLSEVLLEGPRGAASVFTPTALSVQQFSDRIASGFMTAWTVQKRRYLGDIAHAGFLNLWAFNPNVSELSTYQILGDPGLLVNRPGTLPP